MPPHVSDPFSGRLVVRLNPAALDLVTQLPVTPGLVLAENRLLQIVEQVPSLAGLRDVLRRYPNVPSFPAVASATESALIPSLESIAQDSPFPPLHSLRAYYIVDPRGRIGALEVDDLLAALQRTPGVEVAYREPNIQNAAPPVTPWDETIYPGGMSQHFDGNDWGINAVAPSVWGMYDGTGIGFADLESGWNLNHIDLPHPQPPVPLYGLNVGDKNHGAASLGIVVGQDNGQGVVGIAPCATLKKVLSHITMAVGPWPMSSWDIAGAIVNALSPGVLVPGDVLLIEIQAVNEGGMMGCPIETNPLWFDAIRLAAGNGIVVIEPAGNGHIVVGPDGRLRLIGRYLDEWDGDWKSSPTGRTLKKGDAHSDSGAIIVSGCLRDIAPAQAHRRHPELNYGSRVTCYAWGEWVHTCGYGFLTEPPHTGNYGYTDRFAATSAASAIIAGAAVLLQEMHLRSHGRRLAPAQIRALLGDWNLGTCVVDPATDVRIGVMPDLARIAAKLGAVPDVYVRDSVGDAGVVPNTSVFQSPDIILLSKPAINIGEGSPSANQMLPNDPVKANADNYLYVRVRNRSAVDAPMVTANVYWSEASPLVAPVDWHLIGPINAGTVAAGGALHVAGPLIWHPAPNHLPPTGHGCFIAVLDQALDPSPPTLPAAVNSQTLGWADFLAYVGNNNNVAWRNFHVIETPPETWAAMPFCLRGAWDKARRFDLELVAELPDEAQLMWEVPEPLAPALERAGKRLIRRRVPSDLGVGLGLSAPTLMVVQDLVFEPMACHWCRLQVLVPSPRAAGEYQIALRQLYEGMSVGQLTWRIVTTAGR